MTKQASAVLWIGLLLIFINFWLSGQSTAFWNLIAHPGGLGTNSGNSGSSGGSAKLPKGQTSQTGQGSQNPNQSRF